MARCQPVKLRPLGASRATFSLRCGRYEYVGWRAVRRNGEVGIIPASSGPRLSHASMDACGCRCSSRGTWTALENGRTDRR